MHNPPTSVDILITANYVLTMNGSYDTFSPGAVAVNDNSIVAVGEKGIL